MSKKRDDCAVCGTYGFSRTEVKTKPKGGQVLMKQNSTSRAGKIIPFPNRHSQPKTQPHNHKKPWGKYAELHQAFLQTYHPNFYNRLVALDKLDEWLQTIDEIANNRFELGKSVGYSQAEIEDTLFTEVIYNLR